jgi:DNA-binding NtrC family response regulator
MSARILIADDDPIQRRLLESLCHRFNYAVETAAGGDAALARLTASGAPAVSLVILDLVMPGLDGMGVLTRLKQARSTPPVIVQASQGSIEMAAAAVWAGAFDFVVKPAGPERLQVAIKNALSHARLSEELRFLERAQSGFLSFADLSGESAGMARASGQGERAAKSAFPVLLEGEPGTGKESFARAIHGASSRRGRPFVAVNCSAYSAGSARTDSLVESLPAKFAAAQGGTLFLDRICALPLDAQDKLLRLLSAGIVHAPGARRPVKADVRLICAASQDLIPLVKLGLFREDLFYRINIFPVTLPPLRARRDDIGPLAQRLCARFAAEEGKPVRGICAEAQALLCAYDWPGNVRQLENAIFRAVVLARGAELTVADFPQIAARVEGFDLRIPPAPAMAARPALPLREFVRVEVRDPQSLALLDDHGNPRPLDQLEAEAIKFALGHYRGQMSAAARKLGIGRSTLYRKLKQYGLLEREGAAAPVLAAEPPLAARM